MSSSSPYLIQDRVQEEHVHIMRQDKINDEPHKLRYGRGQQSRQEGGPMGKESSLEMLPHTKKYQEPPEAEEEGFSPSILEMVRSFQDLGFLASRTVRK